MNQEELKQKLRILFGAQILFNKEFDALTEHLKNLEENILLWCESVKLGKIRAAPSSYLNGSLIFIKKLGSSNRCVVIKVENGVFREIHLGNHKYYDHLRKKLGLKEDSCKS